MKTHDLKTEQGRKSAIEEIEQSFIKSLRKIGVELSDYVCVQMSNHGVYIQSNPSSFLEVTIYINECRINFGSSGSFTPGNKEAYWRTIHAASVLKNWDKVCEAVNEHCKMYSELVEEINKQSPNNHENT